MSNMGVIMFHRSLGFMRASGLPTTRVKWRVPRIILLGPIIDQINLESHKTGKVRRPCLNGIKYVKTFLISDLSPFLRRELATKRRYFFINPDQSLLSSKSISKIQN